MMRCPTAVYGWRTGTGKIGNRLLLCPLLLTADTARQAINTDMETAFEVIGPFPLFTITIDAIVTAIGCAFGGCLEAIGVR